MLASIPSWDVQLCTKFANSQVGILGLAGRSLACMESPCSSVKVG